MGGRKLWDCSHEDISRGYVEQDKTWSCLFCGEEFESGRIYAIGSSYYEAFRAVAEHVKASHGSVFEYLLEHEQEAVGLTQHQRTMLRYMFEGKNDKEIAAITGAANTASIRNLRFQLREREAQAKAFLSLMEAFRRERAMDEDRGQAVRGPSAPIMADDRFAATERERAATLKTYFSPDGVLKEFPVREKRKLIVLDELASRFEKGRVYSEKEVNALIAYPDYATVRRYLIEYGFLERSPDCSQYRRKEEERQ